jgi:hypothetical protein
MRDFSWGNFAAAPLDRQKMEFRTSSCYLHSMEITVTIPDEVAEKAQARGLELKTYVEELVAENPIPDGPEPTVEEKLAQLERFFAQMSSHAHKIPILSDEALSRESFYSDHA